MGATASLLSQGIPWGAIAFASLLIMIDYFVGIIVAAIQKVLTSSEMRDGLLRKLLLFFALITGVVLKGFFLLANLPHSVVDIFGIGQIMTWAGVETVAEIPVCLFVCTAITLMETYSIIENVAKVNAPIAKLLSHFQNNNEITKEKKDG